jgi:flagellar hook-basal body complex protein FliE
MSQMQINEVLAQIRSFSATRTAGASSAPAAGVGGVNGIGGFGDLLKQGIDAVNRSQQGAANLADSYERGVPGVELAQVMLESQKAAISFRALTEVRNRLVTVYQDIMNMAI